MEKSVVNQKAENKVNEKYIFLWNSTPDPFNTILTPEWTAYKPEPSDYLENCYQQYIANKENNIARLGDYCYNFDIMRQYHSEYTDRQRPILRVKISFNVQVPNLEIRREVNINIPLPQVAEFKFTKENDKYNYYINDKLISSNWEEFCTFLKNDATLTELNLIGMNLGDDPEKMKCFKEALEMNKTLTKLNLRENNFGGNLISMKLLKEALIKNESLKSVDLGKNNIKKYPDAKAIIDEITTIKKIISRF